MTIVEQLAELVDLDTERFKLTDWEIEFVDSVEKWTRGGRLLTANQQATVSKIYDAVFIHGKRNRREEDL